MVSLRRPFEFLLFFFHKACAGVVSFVDDIFWYLMACVGRSDGYIGDVVHDDESSLNEDEDAEDPNWRHRNRAANMMEDDRLFGIITVEVFIVAVPLSF